MPPRRKRSPAPARSSKRQVLRRRPSKLVLDVDQTTEFVRFLLEDAQQGNGRELAYYHAISETLTHFSRCTRPGNTRISVAPQHAFCNDTYPDIIVNRDEPVATRSSNVDNHQELPEDSDTDDEDDAPNQVSNGSAASIESVSSDTGSFHAEETYRAPDFTLWKAIFVRVGINLRVLEKLPFAIVEVKRREIVGLEDGADDLVDVAQAMDETRPQVNEQLTALWREFRERREELQVTFVLMFVGKYFSFYKMKYGETNIPFRRGTKHISCLLNEDETDFSDAFQRQWKQMMNTYQIDMIPGFLRV